MSAVPEMAATLSPTAIGKDFPVDRRWIGLSPSRTGIRVNLGGYVGFTLGWVEGVEINLLNAVAGLDLPWPQASGFGAAWVEVALLPFHPAREEDHWAIVGLTRN